MIKNILQDYFQTENGQKFTQKQDGLEENTTPIQEKLLMDMDTSLLEATENINQSIEKLLKRISEENLDMRKLSTMLTSINKIMRLETYTSLKILANILNVIEVFQKYYQSYWEKMLLDLTLVQENTKYAKISDYISTEEQGISDWVNGSSVKSVIIKKQDIIGHLRGDSGREVLSIFGENGEVNQSTIKQIGNLSDSNSFGGNPQVGRVYGADGISPTLNTMQGGGREPKVMVKEATLVARNEDFLNHGEKVLSKLWGGNSEENYAEWKARISKLVETAEILRQVMYELVLSQEQSEVWGSELVCSSRESKAGEQGNYLSRLWSEEEYRCPSCRFEYSKQFATELGRFMQKLPLEKTQKEKCMQNLWEACERTPAMQQALHQMEKIWGSTLSQSESQFRIRKLTPRETWRLQAFPDELFDRAQQAGLSDSQLYKQAGNSVTVNVIEYIGNLL